MRAKRPIALLLLVLALPFTASAADRNIDLTFWGTWAGVPGDQKFDGFDELGESRIHFNQTFGFGGGVNVFWSSRWSTDFAASWIRPEAEIITVAGDTVAIFRIGRVQIVPVTAVLQYHFSPSDTLDWYLGLGAAYIFLDRVGDIELLQNLEFSSDPGLVAKAGVSYRISDRFALNVEGQVIPLKSSANAQLPNGQTSADVIISPTLLSAGLSYRF